ncbi:MAG: type IV secretory system conjugative DNA transfer family protein [Oscillospiraceae bacterium]|jgi:type IV secretion system protein VirD4|nr:type IV secretory system conjugative DNA transfer family protein [Oscillospiraceae bacterium]
MAVPKLSEHIAKLETRTERRFGRFLSRYKRKYRKYLPLVICGWYFYGMFINSIRLGIRATFGDGGDAAGSIWTANPIKNFLAVFTPSGLGITAVCALLFCLITKKGYIWFSGYKYTKDPRGFDILPDATHGSSGFMTKKEMDQVLRLEPLKEADGTIIGKVKDDPLDDDRYARYVSLKESSRLDNHAIVFGSTGSGKSRGYVRPFIYQAVKRRESILLVDVKGELYEATAEYMRSEEAGYTVKVFNLLDPPHSDGWNPLNDIEYDANLVDAIAETIIKNTSNISERQDFWEKAEKNLLTALIHYVQSQTVPGTNRLLPIEQRSIGAIYQLLSSESFNDLERRFDELPKDHPAKAPYGIFKLAHRQIWGNIAIGLGNRLSLFQNRLLEQITAHNDIDLTLPGRKPCIYYCVISAENTQYEFLSSLFFSCIISRLIGYARREGKGGRLPVTVNLLLEEFCNIGTLGMDYLKQLAILRGFNIFCHHLVQSIPQLSTRYPKDQWEEIISHCDLMICLGANDLKTAGYFSDKCGKVTIRVDNNQMPLTPLFSSIYSSTRPYSQTRSNTQRPLMMPDEVLRMDNRKELVLLRGQKALLLDKITPEEFPLQDKLKYSRVIDYTPAWRVPRSTETESKTGHQKANEITTESAAAERAGAAAPVAEAPAPAVAQAPAARYAGGRPAWYSSMDYAISKETPPATAAEAGDNAGAPGLRQLGGKETTVQSVKDNTGKIE